MAAKAMASEPDPPGPASAIAVPTDESSTVEILTKREVLSVPYRRAYVVLKGLVDAGIDSVDLVFRVNAPNGHESPKGLRLSIEFADQSIPVSVSSIGTFELPINEEAAKQDATLVANRNGLKVSVGLVPSNAPASVDMAYARRAVLQARTARSKLIPWYFRLFVPNIRAFGACSTIATDLVRIVDGGAISVQLQLSEKEEDESGNDLWCAAITGEEPWRDSARIEVPGGLRSVFLSTAF